MCLTLNLFHLFLCTFQHNRNGANIPLHSCETLHLLQLLSRVQCYIYHNGFVSLDITIKCSSYEKMICAFAIIFVTIILNSNKIVKARFVEQTKLIGNGYIAEPSGVGQGISVSLSNDGSTALIGGYKDSNLTGAAWVFSRNGSNWTQLGEKLVGNDSVGREINQGITVCISGDSNTALVGGWTDNGGKGAAWIFVRNSSGMFEQQGTKLTSNQLSNTAGFGFGVALSFDGNTALIGAPLNQNDAGGTWVYVRSHSGIWNVQAENLLGNDTNGVAQQGYSVALSHDGNTAIVGGILDNDNIGASWIFTRNGQTWTQQGKKLVGALGVESRQGYSVAMNAAGTLAVIGGFADDSFNGAAWVFALNDTSSWIQQGPKLTPLDATSQAAFGSWVALDDVGNVSVIGGSLGSSDVGAAWVFKYDSQLRAWFQDDAKLVASDSIGGSHQGIGVAISGDGKIILIGGDGDDSDIGATWVFVDEKTQTTQPTSPTLNPTISNAATTKFGRILIYYAVYSIGLWLIL
jgi:hypothetical protein